MSKRWNDFSYKEREWLLALYEGDPAALDEIYPTLDTKMALNSLKAKLREHRNYRQTYIDSQIARVSMPSPLTRLWIDAPILDGNNFIIISDVEVPDHDPVMLTAAAALGIRHGIKHLVIAGDLVATDQKSLNHWVNVWPDPDAAMYEEVIASTQAIVHTYSEVFEKIDCIEGNHDDRVARATGGEVHLGMFLNHPQLRYSRYRYLWLKTRRGYFYVSHPQNYSANSAALGQKLYNKLRAPDGSKPAAVILGHTHQPQEALSPDGGAEIYALGACRHPLRTQYVMAGSNTHHQWGQSIIMVKNGFVHHLVRNKTDWSFYLGENCPPALTDENQRNLLYGTETATL